MFLTGTVARRVFGLLMLAAIAPLGLSALIAWQAMQAQWTETRHRLQTQALQQHGLRLFDRLQAAQAVLAAEAGSGMPLAAHRRPTHEVRRLAGAWPSVLAERAGPVQPLAASTDATGIAVADPPAWLAAWRRVASEAAAAGRPDRSLWWLTSGSPEDGRTAHVIVGHRDPDGRGWWLARVDPRYLWDDFAAHGTAAALCVGDADAQVVHCGPDADRRSVMRGGGWRLFLAAGFDSPDWILSAADGWNTAPAVPGPADGPLGRAIPLALLGAVLLAVALTLLMVRRTMVPLERLQAVTRRLAAGDWDARADLQRRDEFGDLARSFDAMAARIGEQVRALDARSSIDRAVIGGESFDALLARVLARLQEIVPGGQAVVLARAPSGQGWVAAVGNGRSVGTLEDAQLDPLLTRLANEPAWVDVGVAPVAAAFGPVPPRGDLPSGSCVALAVRWRGAVLAILVLADGGPLDDVRRAAVEELRDHVAVSLAAAAREQELRRRACIDSLTGLLNRAGLHEAIEQALAQPDQTHALVFVDLDGFKSVNDSLGHRLGDRLLEQVAQRLRVLAPPPARIARPGGDEFVLLMPGDVTAAQALAAAACEQLAAPFEVDELRLHVGASAGFACCPADGKAADELMRRADLALYEAKAAGRGMWRRYEPRLEAVAVERAWMVQQLRAAIAGGQLGVVFQPRVEMHTRKLVSVEALARWTHPARGAIPPSTFIGLAEDSGLIVPLGAFVLDASLAALRRWRDAGLDVPGVAVNVSARQLADPAFVPLVLERLEAHRVQPRDLEPELTESLFAGDPHRVAAQLAPLRECGVRIALDDFGTGYSSLAALHALPVDVLKIDRSFVDGIERRAGALAIVQGVIAVGRALGRRIVAEGVETPQQHALITQLGCDEGQGWLYACPMPAHALAGHLARTRDADASGSDALADASAHGAATASLPTG